MGVAAPGRAHGGRVPGGDRAPESGRGHVMSRSILFVAYFYPPCADAGAHRPAAMVKYLRRLGHRVTVLTTAAYGDPDDADVVRTTDLQLVRARIRGKDHVQAMYESDTYSGR